MTPAGPAPPTAAIPPAPGEERGPALADLLAALAALGRSLPETLDPRAFLREFSGHFRRLVPHERLVVAHRDDDGPTFTVFAETATHGPPLHEGHYTIDFHPAGRYPVAAWTLGAALAGESGLVNDFAADPRWSGAGPVELRVQAEGFRAALAVPLHAGGRVVGALVASSLAPGVYTDAHLAVARRVADLAGPLIETVVLLHRERRRRHRLRALEALTRALGASLNVGEVFERLAGAVRPVLDFDIMGVALVTASGRDVEILAEVDDLARTEPHAGVALDQSSFSEPILAGRPVLIDDARVQLDPRLAGDRMVLEDGGRACLAVPLHLGEVVGGALYFGKRQPGWFDEADVEVARGVAAQVVLALQHQRLAEEQRRLAAAEGRARQLEQRLQTLRGELDRRYGFDRIIGRAPSLRAALARAARVAPAETTVLLTGESGTGKELVARAIHQASPRAEGPFVALNCAALPEGLLESELFGHERGAFTGADRQKAGRFELARGGTLFLDEIGELTHGVQAKLLRVLQEREFQRVGGTTTLRADVRLIAATNRDLAGMVAAGQFREDLYYRLNVFSVHLPPLRERGDDVLLLADHVVRELGGQMGRGEPGLSRSARDALLAHPWPGNIRELQNAVERALIMCEGGLITAEHLALPPAHPGSPAPPDGGPAGSLPAWERRMVVDALEKARGNKSRAARMLGLSRSQLYTRLKRFGLDGGTP